MQGSGQVGEVNDIIYVTKPTVGQKRVQTRHVYLWINRWHLDIKQYYRKHVLIRKVRGTIRAAEWQVDVRNEAVRQMAKDVEEHIGIGGNEYLSPGYIPTRNDGHQHLWSAFVGDLVPWRQGNLSWNRWSPLHLAGTVIRTRLCIFHQFR